MRPINVENGNDNAYTKSISKVISKYPVPNQWYSDEWLGRVFAPCSWWPGKRSPVDDFGSLITLSHPACQEIFKTKWFDLKNQVRKVVDPLPNNGSLLFFVEKVDIPLESNIRVSTIIEIWQKEEWIKSSEEDWISSSEEEWISSSKEERISSSTHVGTSSCDELAKALRDRVIFNRKNAPGTPLLTSKRFEEYDPDILEFADSLFWVFTYNYIFYYNPRLRKISVRQPTHEDLCNIGRQFTPPKVFIHPLKRAIPRDIIECRPAHISSSSKVCCQVSTGAGLRKCWLDLPTACRLGNVGFVTFDLETLVYKVHPSPAKQLKGRQYSGGFVYCKACNRWDVEYHQRTKCNLCGSKIDYVSSNRWVCVGSHLGDNGFLKTCYGRGQSPLFAGDECSRGCGIDLVAAKRAKISIGYHKLTQISDTEYIEETQFIGEASHKKSHEQKMYRDRGKLQHWAGRGSLGIGSIVGCSKGKDVIEIDKDQKKSRLTLPPLFDECGGVVRYNEIFEKECSECGLIDSPIGSPVDYIALTNYFNMTSRDEPEAQGDKDWILQELARGSDRYVTEVGKQLSQIRRAKDGKEEVSTNEAQHKIWLEAARLPKFIPGQKHQYIPHKKRHLIDLRIMTLLNQNGGRIEQASIPQLFESEFKTHVTARQVEEAVKQIVKAYQSVGIENVYSARGKRIVIFKLHAYQSIANTESSSIILREKEMILQSQN